MSWSFGLLKKSSMQQEYAASSKVETNLPVHYYVHTILKLYPFSKSRQKKRKLFSSHHIFDRQLALNR